MKNKNQLTRTLVAQYFIISGIGIAIVVGLPLFLQALLSKKIWYAEDPFFLILHRINQNLIPILIILFIIIWTISTWIFVYRIVMYFNELSNATKQIINKPEENVSLSPILDNFEKEMNEIRSDNLNNINAVKEEESRKNTLIMYIAHDLRTPLTSIIGYLSLLRNKTQYDTKETKKYINITLEKANRLDSLINEFFEITKFNLNDIKLEKQDVNLSVMLNQLSFEFKPLLQQKTLHLNTSIKSNISTSLDIERFERVFDNIMKNAINYAPSNSELKLSFNESNNNYILQLKNAIDKNNKIDLDNIFEPFYRGDSSRQTKNGGTGLGLSISKKIIEKLDGTMSASINNEEQFIITILLPR